MVLVLIRSLGLMILPRMKSWLVELYFFIIDGSLSYRYLVLWASDLLTSVLLASVLLGYVSTNWVIRNILTKSAFSRGSPLKVNLCPYKQSRILSGVLYIYVKLGVRPLLFYEIDFYLGLVG